MKYLTTEMKIINNRVAKKKKKKNQVKVEKVNYNTGLMVVMMKK